MQRVTYCLACGVPLVKKEDFGGGNPENRYCCNCSDEKGNLLKEPTIRDGIMRFWRSRNRGGNTPSESFSRNIEPMHQVRQ